MYTRNGAFQLDKEGYVVTANGDYVMAITIPETVAPEDVDVMPLVEIDNGDPVVDEATGDPLFTKIQLLGTVRRGEDDPATTDVDESLVVFDEDGDETTTEDATRSLAS
jgi:flagellar basal body rod protein FlgG